MTTAARTAGPAFATSNRHDAETTEVRHAEGQRTQLRILLPKLRVAKLSAHIGSYGEEAFESQDLRRLERGFFDVKACECRSRIFDAADPDDRAQLVQQAVAEATFRPLVHLSRR